MKDSTSYLMLVFPIIAVFLVILGLLFSEINKKTPVEKTPTPQECCQQD